MQKKYLTEEKFDEWKGNDFRHFTNKIIRMEGILWVLAPLVIAILVVVISISRNG